MIMKAVNDLLHKNESNEIALETNQMALSASEFTIINKRIYGPKNEKVNLAKNLLWH